MAKQAVKKAEEKPAKQVAVRDGGGSVPAFMKQDIGKGQDAIDRSDIDIPRLILVQSTHTEILDSYNKLRPGMYFHKATETIFDEPVKIVPVFFEKRYILWNPLDSGGGILARADDGKHWSPPNQSFTVKLDKKNGGGTVTWKTAATVEESGLAGWGTMDPNDPNSPPAATLMYNYLVAFPDFPDLLPAVLTYQRSAIKIGKRFNTRLKTTRTPMFGLVFEIGSTKAQNGNNQTFYMPSWTGAGDLRDNEALYKELRDMNEGLSERGLRIRDEDELQAEGTTDDEPGSETEQPTQSGRARPKY